MTHEICRLTAKNRDQLRNSMLGNRVWAIFTFLSHADTVLDSARLTHCCLSPVVCTAVNFITLVCVVCFDVIRF